MDDRAQVKWLGGTEWDVSDHIYIEDGRLPAVFSKDLLTNGNHIFLGRSKLDVHLYIYIYGNCQGFALK